MSTQPTKCGVCIMGSWLIAAHIQYKTKQKNTRYFKGLSSLLHIKYTILHFWPSQLAAGKKWPFLKREQTLDMFPFNLRCFSLSRSVSAVKVSAWASSVKGQSSCFYLIIGWLSGPGRALNTAQLKTLDLSGFFKCRLNSSDKNIDNFIFSEALPLQIIKWLLLLFSPVLCPKI